MGSKSKPRQALDELREQLGVFRETAPAWYADYEDIDPFVAARADVEHLLATAPDGFCKGLILGILVQRQMTSAITNREF